MFSKHSSNGLLVPQIYRALGLDIIVQTAPDLLSLEDPRLKGYYLDAYGLSELFLGLKEEAETR